MKILINDSIVTSVLKETETLIYTHYGRFKKSESGRLKGYGHDKDAVFISEEGFQKIKEQEILAQKKSSMVTAIYDNIHRGSILYKCDINDIQIIYDQLVKMNIIKGK
jgi:hypothetical protein